MFGQELLAHFIIKKKGGKLFASFSYLALKSHREMPCNGNIAFQVNPASSIHEIGSPDKLIGREKADEEAFYLL